MDRHRRHGPNRLSRYLQIHDTVLEQFLKNGLVSKSHLKFESGQVDGEFLVLSGEVSLREGVLRLQVSKTLEVVEDDARDPLVQTSWYSYNISIPGHGNVFRYDSPHDDGQVHEHHRYHHRHQYDPLSDHPKSYVVTLIKNNDWPILHEVVEEAEAWFWDHQEQLRELGLVK